MGLGRLGAVPEHLGNPWGVPGSFLDRLGVVLGASWAVSGSSWAVLGPSWGQLGPSWAVLGASWGVLGESWAVLGQLGAPWGGARGLLERGWSAIRANPSVYTKTYKNLRTINDFGGPGRVLGGSRGGLGASWGRLGGLLGSLGRVLGRLGSVLGPLEGVLGRLGASWRGPEADFVTPTTLFEGPRPETLHFTKVLGEGGVMMGMFRGPAAVFGRRGEDYRRGEELMATG